MNKKYIVKNCPAYQKDNWWTCSRELDTYKNHLNCENCTDCLIKQIAQKCFSVSDISEFQDYILNTLQVKDVQDE